VRKGLTLVELLVSVVMFLIIIAAVYSFFISFLNQQTFQRKKAEALKETRIAFRVLEDDIRHAGFGFPKSSPCKDKGLCLFFVEDNCDYHNEQFCKTGTDRFFVADGWKIIKDFTLDGYPDGNITNIDYELLASSKFSAKVLYYSDGDDFIVVDRLDIDNKTDVVNHKADDIVAKKGIIVCGRTNNGGRVGQEGRRIEKIISVSSGWELKFHSLENPLDYKNDCSGDRGIVLPANVWYVREKDGHYWLYRNESPVLQDVEDFQIHVGYDFDGDGVVEDSEWINAGSLPDDASYTKLKFFWFEIKKVFYWKGKKYQVDNTLRVEAFH